MKVIIIYNPNSTGDSKANAKKLSGQLKKRGIQVETIATDHPGHGEEIAEKYARQNKSVVLISASGDGGYNEVINEALSSPSDHLVVGVLASGNANDHASALNINNLAKSISEKNFKHIDTLEIIATVKGKPWKRYAHSYAGLGVTAQASKKLTEERPNEFSEKWIVLKSLFSFGYVKLVEDGKNRRYSSILFANIDRMSKVLKLSEESSITDGKFEISSIRFRSKLRLILYFLTAASFGLKRTQSVKSFQCKVTKPTLIQIDGETFTIDAGSKLQVRAIKQNLHTVL